MFLSCAFVRRCLLVVVFLGGWMGVAQADYRLAPGDAIRIQVFQNPDLTVEARVSENGGIRYPLIGLVQVGGLAVGEGIGASEAMGVLVAIKLGLEGAVVGVE